MPRINQTITVNAGTPVNIGTGTGTNDGIPRPASRYTIVMLHAANCQVAQLLSAAYNGQTSPRTPSVNNPGDIVTEIAPASSTAPGIPFSDTESIDRGGIDMTELWIDGAHTGDKIQVSYWPKV